MRIGVPKEIKDHEYRVAMIPAGVRTLAEAGHTVFVQAGAGEGSGIPDEAYRAAGASILPSAKEVYAKAEMIVKVKEPLPSEIPLLREGQILFTFLHLAADVHLTRGLMDRRVTAIAYETVEGEGGFLPILVPMSEVAGRMAVILGAQFLQKRYGGAGVLLGGVPGVAPGRVLILGAGTVGRNALRMAVGLGAHVTVANRILRPLQNLDDSYMGRVTTLAMNEENIEEEARLA
ncbi:MAG: alanine dehydrogenase, partial [Nitrospirae bacterium]|nr:alanine dehydrogenase [Nitrospirota bacterium]